MSLRIPPLPPEVAPSVRALVTAANTFRHVLVTSAARPLEEVLGEEEMLQVAEKVLRAWVENVRRWPATPEEAAARDASLRDGR